MAAALALGALTFLFAVLWGGPLIRFLRRRRVGEQIRIDGPATHQLKTGTPTMGGIMIIGPVTIVTLLMWAIDQILPSLSGALAPDIVEAFGQLVGESIFLPLGTLLACGVVGALDDLQGVARQQRALASNSSQGKAGILGRWKFVAITAIALLVSLGLHFVLELRSLAIPTLTQKIDIGLLYIPLATFIIVGSSNAVNLTDGLDGLAGGAAAIAFVAYGVIAFLQGQVFLVLFCFTVMGPVLAFLWYNAYPAQLFMGDTGSLALGATLAVVALMTGQWLLLPIVSLVFVAETLSVILQVAYFRWTRGRRIFKMSPLHHHFELLGWSEVQVVQRFWLASMLAGMLGVALALL
ncbi:MAG: phospho-N-acetylmuramoyl-pentapeptide-transferase [Chloroflexi bacterium]|nr:phospho-N-acetylmuramoyl-pentapeptide-transferase [Chloroflexota bacterium]